MRRSTTCLLLVFAGILVLSGCQWVGEPWDNAGYFKDKRVRTTAVQKNLRDRVMHSQSDFEFTAHQTEYR